MKLIYWGLLGFVFFMIIVIHGFQLTGEVIVNDDCKFVSRISEKMIPSNICCDEVDKYLYCDLNDSYYKCYNAVDSTKLYVPKSLMNRCK